MDAVTGTTVVVIAVDAWRHLKGRSDHLLLATLPLLLGAHQLVEDFVWWGLQGHVSAALGRLALYVYLFIAFVVLPIFVPLAIVAGADPSAEVATGAICCARGDCVHGPSCRHGARSGQRQPGSVAPVL